VMTRGQQDTGVSPWPDGGQPVGAAGTQTCPACSKPCAGQAGIKTRGALLQVGHSLSRGRRLVAGTFHGGAEEKKTGSSWDHIPMAADHGRMSSCPDSIDCPEATAGLGLENDHLTANGGNLRPRLPGHRRQQPGPAPGGSDDHRGLQFAIIQHNPGYSPGLLGKTDHLDPGLHLNTIGFNCRRQGPAEKARINTMIPRKVQTGRGRLGQSRQKGV
jgi:hypothetical protein